MVDVVISDQITPYSKTKTQKDITSLKNFTSSGGTKTTYLYIWQFIYKWIQDDIDTCMETRANNEENRGQVKKSQWNVKTREKRWHQI